MHEGWCLDLVARVGRTLGSEFSGLTFRPRGSELSRLGDAFWNCRGFKASNHDLSQLGGVWGLGCRLYLCAWRRCCPMGLIQLGYLAGRNAAGVEGLGWRRLQTPLEAIHCVLSCHDDVRF